MSVSVSDFQKAPRPRRKIGVSAVYAKTIGVMSVGGGAKVDQHVRGVPDAVPQLHQVEHEQTFYKLTKIRASHPARVALLRVLREDVTVAEVRRLWYARALRFDGQVFVLDPSRVWMQLGCTAVQMVAASLIALVCYLDGRIGHTLAITLLGMVWCFWAALSASSLHERYVYPVRRLAKVIEQINADIPELLQEPDA
jgi:hypothetical protein